MAVQIASSASDLAQVCAPAKTVVLSADAGAEFKNILQGIRETRQNMAQTVPREPKTPVNFVFPAAEDGGIAASPEPAAPLTEEPEMTPDAGQEAPLSRFDPDVFLEALAGAAADKPDARGTDADKDTEDAEEDGSASEDAAENPEDAPPAGENKAQPAVPVPPAEITGTADADVKDAQKSSDETVERPVQTTDVRDTQNAATNDLPAETTGTAGADAKNAQKSSDDTAERPVQTADARDIPNAEANDLSAEDTSQETKPRKSQDAGADELPGTDINDDAPNAEDVRHETSSGGEHDVTERGGPRAAKASARAADTDTARPAADVAAGKSFREEASSAGTSPERAADPQIPAAGPFGGQISADARPVFQAPAIYTLMSADKFGEGLRSVMTIMTRDGGAEARIVVEPPALGRVDISLRSSAGGVEANFRVDNEELRQMVQKQLDSLKESLTAQGIHISGMTVDIKNNEGDRGKTGVPKKGRRSARAGGAEELDEDIGDSASVLRLDLEKGLLHWVA
jgi:flagellar hook-length control protein FliK